VLWLLSLITPTADAGFIGAAAPFVSLWFGVLFIRDAFSGEAWLAALGLVLIIGALANLTPFMRTPRWMSMVVPFIPWIYIASLYAYLPTGNAVFEYYFFYPWAAGLALIHVARLLDKP
jgi:hypothetical protein